MPMTKVIYVSYAPYNDVIGLTVFRLDRGVSESWRWKISKLGLSSLIIEARWVSSRLDSSDKCSRQPHR